MLQSPVTNDENIPPQHGNIENSNKGKGHKVAKGEKESPLKSQTQRVRSSSISSTSSVYSACRVFGELVVGEEYDGDDYSATHSLCYSPSPKSRIDQIEKEIKDNVYKYDESASNEVPTPLRFSFVKPGDCRGKGEDSTEATKDQSSGIRKMATGQNEVTQPTLTLKASNTITLKQQRNKRRDLQKKIIEAVDCATTSMNESINAATRAKKEAEKEKRLETARLREERRAEYDEAVAFNIELERTKKELLNVREEMSSKYRRARAEWGLSQRQARRDASMKELNFKSEVFRDHQRTLRENEEQRKRLSIDVKAKIRAENRAGVERMKLERIEEDQILHDERYESSVALGEVKDTEAEQRRKSFAFRNSEGKRHRDEAENMRHEEISIRHASNELKWAGEKDAEDHQRLLAKERRESFEFRNQEGMRQREYAEQARTEKLAEIHESYELKWAAEKDVEEYQKHLAEIRRKSLAFRNGEGKRHQDQSEKTKSEVLNAMHDSFELKWAGEMDAECHDRQLEEERRASLRVRNSEARRQRDFAAQQKSDLLAFEHETYELKWAGEKDAAEYIKKLTKARRDSFAFRNDEGKCHRDYAEQKRVENLHIENESYELKWQGEKDAEQYQEHMAQNRRESLQLRNKEAKRVRDLKEQMKDKAQTASHESFELKWAGEKDAENYELQLQKERRESFAFRNGEGKRHRDLADQQKTQKIVEQHDSLELKWAGERDAEEYAKQLAEERRDSIAFRNKEGKRHRDLDDQQEASKQIQQHDSYELKWAGEKDAEKYKQHIAKEKRDSFAFRNEEGKGHRKLECQARSEKIATEHDSYELKWAGEKDAEQYQRLMAKEKRESLAFRNEDGCRLRDLAEKDRLDKISLQHESYELKWAGDRDANEYIQELERERRESFALRNQDGKRQRDYEQEVKNKTTVMEHESFELKCAGERDVQGYKMKIAEENRRSLNLRNAEGKRQRDIEDQTKSELIITDHANYELKWAGEDDAHNYRMLLEQERRESFALHNSEAKRQRDLADQMRAEFQAAEHESMELKWAGQKDAIVHQRLLERERRDSLSFRNAEAKRHRALMDEIRTLANEKERESLVLKWAGQDDVKAYLAGQAEEKRKSLAFRNAEGVRYREITNENIENEVRKAAEEELLQAACSRDVAQYRQECAARDRASFQLRQNEARLHRLMEEEDRQMALRIEHEGYELDAEARRDVNEYVKQCKKRNRLSLAYRAKEKRSHAQHERQKVILEREARSQDTRDRAMDARYVQLAKEKERAMKAIQDYQNSNRSFANPFASLLFE